MYPLLQRCDDVRYNGPMRTIFYDYQSGGPHGAIIDEKYPGIGAVSSIDPVLPTGHGTVDTFTETRGDGPTRTITYTHLVPCMAMTARRLRCVRRERASQSNARSLH